MIIVQDGEITKLWGAELVEELRGEIAKVRARLASK